MVNLKGIIFRCVNTWYLPMLVTGQVLSCVVNGVVERCNTLKNYQGTWNMPFPGSLLRHTFQHLHYFIYWHIYSTIAAIYAHKGYIFYKRWVTLGRAQNCPSVSVEYTCQSFIVMAASIQSKSSKKPWTPKEDATLLRLIDEYGSCGSWYALPL